MERKKAIGEAVQGLEASGARKKKLQNISEDSQAPASLMRMRLRKFSGEGRGIKILAMLGVLISSAGYVYSNIIRQEIRQLVSESGAWQRQNQEIKQKIDSLNFLQNRLAKENWVYSKKLDSLKFIHLALSKPVDKARHSPGVETSRHDLFSNAVAARSSAKIIKYLEPADLHRDGQLPIRNPESIQTMIAKHNATIHAFYQKALKKNPRLKGNLTIRFTIDAEGRLIDPEIAASDSALQAELTTAILHSMQKWKDFGAAAGEQKFRVTYSFEAKTTLP